MLNLVLFGPPGSGKGTQSQKIIDKYSLVHLSTGDILRGEIASKTELGKKAQEIIARGELVSDNIVVGMIKNKLQANQDAKGFIFDGFPRTVAQAEALDHLLNALDTEISYCVSLVVEKQELIGRLLKRGEECGREDDKLETIENRISVYENQTAPVANYYEGKGKYHPINGVGSIEDIFKRIEQELDK